MTMTYNFESPAGVPQYDNVFDPGAELVVNLHVTGFAGLPEWLMPTHVSIVGGGINLYGDSITNIGGNSSIIFTLPNINAQAVVTMWHDYILLTGDDKLRTAIGVGMLPGRLPDESWVSALKWLGVAAIAGASIYLLAKFIPQRRQ